MLCVAETDYTDSLYVTVWQTYPDVLCLTVLSQGANCHRYIFFIPDMNANAITHTAGCIETRPSVLEPEMKAHGGHRCVST